jgi:hypothetical protein
MKKQTKAVAAKRPRTYKKSDLPRTARAYLGKTYGIYMDKENEAVARLIELHEDRRKELKNHYAENIYPLPAAVPAFVRDPEPKKLTLLEQFLAWIGVKNG